MAEKSSHLETLERLQHSMDNFDAAFSVSNKLFRLAIVSEILDTTCMFEQLLGAWEKRLPIGEGPDADIDFAYWSDMSTWSDLQESAQQNLCIDTTSMDLGNGVTTDELRGNQRKSYARNLKTVLKSSHYVQAPAVVEFVKFIEADKSGTMTFGNMVFYALHQLCLVLRKIHSLQNAPNEQLFIAYYDQQLSRFKPELTEWNLRIKNKMREPIQDRRKVNALHQFKDDLRESLRNSGFLNDLMDDITKYDVNDYREANADIELSDDQVKEEVALNDLHTSTGEPDKKQIAHYIYTHRKQFSRETIGTFFTYIITNIEIEKRLTLMGTIVTSKKAEAHNPHDFTVVDAIREQTEAIRENSEELKKVAERKTIDTLILEQNNHGDVKELTNKEDNKRLLTDNG